MTKNVRGFVRKMQEQSLLNSVDGVSHKVHFKSSEKMKEVKKESVQCVVTSPPYWDLKNYNVDGQIGYKESYEEYHSRLEIVWNECFRVLKKDGSFWINVHSKKHNSETYLIPLDIIRSLNKIGFFLKDILIWHKSSGIPSGEKRFGQHFEYILFFVKDKNNFKFRKESLDSIIDYKIENLTSIGDVWNIKKKAGNIGKDVPHPAIFPVEMIRRIIKVSTDKIDVVLDPFLGSGTTTLAAIELHRSSVGYELNEKDYKPLIEKVISKKWILEFQPFTSL
ncbi:site-specific DNA-methyltransferase [Marine Group I thaumarchaeote]|nr:site-specific DNA-methyltransferase [Marine Group I thaumarchaeote]